MGCNILESVIENEFAKKIKISGSRPPDGEVGKPYSFRINASIENESDDNDFDYRFNFEDGTLPPGLEFTTNRQNRNDYALVSGTPSQAGEYTFAVRVKSEKLDDLKESEEDRTDGRSVIRSETEGYYTILIR
jgi:hypothetical protein